MLELLNVAIKKKKFLLYTFVLFRVYNFEQMAIFFQFTKFSEFQDKVLIFETYYV